MTNRAIFRDCSRCGLLIAGKSTARYFRRPAGAFQCVSIARTRAHAHLPDNRSLIGVASKFLTCLHGKRGRGVGERIRAADTRRKNFRGADSLADEWRSR